MVRYISPVNPAVYPHLAITLLSIGLFFMAWFFVYPPPLQLCMYSYSKLHIDSSVVCLHALAAQAHPTASLASQMVSPVLMGVTGSAAGKKGLVSLGPIPWHLQECRRIQ